MAVYSGIFLDEASRKKLLRTFKVPYGWTIDCDHLTIKMGSVPIELEDHIGKVFKLRIIKIGWSDTAMALGVHTNITDKKTPHITFAINEKIGGRPKDSNNITKWKSVKPITVTGTLQEK